MTVPLRSGIVGCTAVALALIAAGQVHAQASALAPAAALPVNTGGRTITEPDGALSFGWPGVYFEGRFRGAGVRLRFDAPREHMRLLIDGETRLAFDEAGQVDVTLTGLSPGDHVARLEKVSESQTGGGRFIGFYPVADAVALPAIARTRRIEFIGDSYTVGYGDTSDRRDCTVEEVHDLTDTQRAFGPIVARRYDAEYRINAYSGFGVVRNYAGGVPDLTLPLIYPRLKPDDAARVEDIGADWRPRLIVINLGTNDFSTDLSHGERWPDRRALEVAYRQAYVAFVTGLHRDQPQARFLLMGSDLFYDQVEEVADTLNADAPGLATTLRFGDLDRDGCHSHPSLADQARLAVLVEAAIQQMGDVWGEAATATAITPQR